MIKENELKIYVYAIAKNEEKFVERFCESAKEADGIIILDTGSTDKTVELAKKCGALVYEASIQPWRFDVARNLSLYHVPNDADVCFCADLDDILQPGWRKEIEKFWIKGKTTNMKYLYQYGKNLTFYYSKIHTKQNFLRKHMCHEYLFIDPRIKEEAVVTNKLLSIHDPDVTKPRSSYLALLEADLLDNQNNTRSMYYYGRELFYVKSYAKAIEEFNKYLNVVTDPTSLDRNFIMRTKAECLKQLNQTENALDVFRQATQENPKIRDSWLALSQFCYILKKWQECLYAACMGLEINFRVFHYTLSGYSWGYKLFDLAAIAAYNLNIKSLSIKYGKKALEQEPNDGRLRTNLTYYENMADLLD